MEARLGTRKRRLNDEVAELLCMVFVECLFLLFVQCVTAWVIVSNSLAHIDGHKWGGKTLRQ